MKKTPFVYFVEKYKFVLVFLAIIFVTIFITSYLIQRPKETKIGFGASLPGDVNGDGMVDIIDFQLLSNSFGKSSGQSGFNAGADFNSDNTVDILDFQMQSNNFGRVITTNTPTIRVSNTPVPTTKPTNTPTPIQITNSPTPPISGTDPVIMAAGDIICDSLGTPSSTSCNHMAVSQLMLNKPPAAVLAVGDLCHSPTANCYSNYYGPSWGRLKSITKPITGNHEYLTTNATPFFDYFNGVGNLTGPAGDRDKGYYSFDIGTWHVIALNSQCSSVGGCGTTSPQYKWLESDLKAHSNKCTMAYYHIPVFSSGNQPSNNALQMFTLLYNYNAEIILNGHDHIYERFAPQNPSGNSDSARGIREFIVGTGGANHTSIASIKPNSEIRNANTFGVIKLTLHPNSYDWQFLPVSGSTFTDSGTNNCH